MGPIEQKLIRQAINMGQPIPDKIQNAPDLIVGLQLYLQAFFDLDSERNHAWGYQRIPWTSIIDYADAFKLDREQRSDLIFFIKKMDQANYERLENKKTNERTNKSSE